MADHSEGQPGSGAAPVFVDNSGGRRRTWRRLGMAMGMAGGGYALVVAVSVIGGNSDAPWGVLIPGAGNSGSGAVRVVPEEGEDAQKRMPGTAAAGTAEPEPSASASSASAGVDRARGRGSSTEKEPSEGRAASGADGKTSVSGGTAGSGDSNSSGSSGGGTKGGQGGSAPTPGNPPAEPSDGGAAGSAGGTPSEPGDGPGEPTPSESPSGGGLLEEILEPILGGGDGPSTTGAE
ncbi:hypothetical protein ACFPA8_26520 [Streptomyces ovatisporus]|uniref:Uncharacterized protein n=1 Tax=Streptomyces ovatisporus TaxID=1128682 RepID=A0ABV9ADA2_9ACTN